MAEDRNTDRRGSSRPTGGKHAARHAAHGATRPRQGARQSQMDMHRGGAPAAPRASQHPRRGSAQVSAARVTHRQVSRSDLASALPTISSQDEQSAPRPIGVDPSATGAFRRISAGEGATVETRENVGKVSPDSTNSWSRVGLGAEMRLQGSSRPQVEDRPQEEKGEGRRLSQQLREHWIILVALIAVIVVGGFLMHGCLDSVQKAGSNGGKEPQQAQTTADGSVTYQGTVFSIAQRDDGSYVLQGHPEESGDNDTYMEFTGTPVQLILYNGAILIPENVDGGWDVLAYTIGSGSVGSQVVDENEQPVGGSGSIQSVELHEKELLVTDDGGKVTRVSLE